MTFNRSQLEALINYTPVCDQPPWAHAELDSKEVEELVRDVVSQLCRELDVQDKTEYGDYGSGYASFFDCWLYRDTDEFRLAPDQNHYIGLVILFSRLTNYFVVLEGEKSWDETSAVSYVPYFDMVDQFDHEEVLQLAQRAIPIIESRGWERLTSQQLAPLLPDGLAPHTILADTEFRQFDALFYWED